MPGDVVEIRSVIQRGGSISLNIPSDIVKSMGLSPGCPVVFQYDDESKRILIEKVQSINTDTGKTIDVLNTGC